MNPAQPFSIEVAHAYGIDITAHRARQLTAEIINVSNEPVHSMAMQQYFFTTGKIKNWAILKILKSWIRIANQKKHLK